MGSAKLTRFSCALHLPYVWSFRHAQPLQPNFKLTLALLTRGGTCISADLVIKMPPIFLGRNMGGGSLVLACRLFRLEIRK